MVLDERNKTLFVCVYQMPVMLIRIHEIIIMIYMIFWGTIYVIIKQKKLVLASLPCAKTMAHGKDLNFAVCHASRAHGKVLATSSFLGATFFCRGSRVAHGKPFVVCPIYSTRQRPALLTPGCRVRFAMCGTRQSVCRGLLGLYRVPLAHRKGGGGLP